MSAADTPTGTEAEMREALAQRMPPHPEMHANAEWHEHYARWHAWFIRKFVLNVPAALATPPAPASGWDEAIEAEVRFLLDRLDEFSADNLIEDGAVREWFGHVEPSVERLRKALINDRALRPATPPAQEQRNVSPEQGNEAGAVAPIEPATAIIGRTTIELLAKNGQVVFEGGPALIAASDLYQNSPYTPPAQAAAPDAMREALKPFANCAARYDDEPYSTIGDGCQLWQLEGNSAYRVDITVGDLRRARTALASPKRADGWRTESLDLAELRALSEARQAAWCPDQVPDLSFRGNELAGEVGEACNVIKKLERERQGWRGSRATVEELADELADVVICADLAAMSAGVDLGAAVRRKFNATSDKVGLPHKLKRPLPASPATGEG